MLVDASAMLERGWKREREGAAEKYKPNRGFRFSTYTMYWIQSAIKQSQTKQSRKVTLPQRIHETHKRVTREEAWLRKELGCNPTMAKLANACNITVLQLQRCRVAMGQVTYSLDAEVQNTHKPNSGNSRKDTMYDIVEGMVDEMEYERTQQLLMKEHLIRTLHRYLLPHEVDLLLLRYGLMDKWALPRGMLGPLTIAEVTDKEDHHQQSETAEALDEGMGGFQV
jgi:DNA-directed RNA polymerase sigma subunit (sigma70/sigma32)